jgi:hypothetical protein
MKKKKNIVEVLNLLNNPSKEKMAKEILMALKNIAEYEKGKTKLKSARELVDEIF